MRCDFRKFKKTTDAASALREIRGTDAEKSHAKSLLTFGQKRNYITD